MKVERLNHLLANHIGNALQYDTEQTAVLAYGLFGLIQTFLSILIIIIVSALFGVTYEALIVSFSIAILRKYSGGAHATSAERCLILGTLFTISGALLSVFLATALSISSLCCIGLILFIWSLSIIYKKAPVDTPNKPITNPNKQLKLKQRSLLIVFIYFIFTLALLLAYSFYQFHYFKIYMLCLILGMSWQVFSMISIGHQVAHLLDHVLIYISQLLMKKENEQ